MGSSRQVSNMLAILPGNKAEIDLYLSLVTSQWLASISFMTRRREG
jgi:hypothetical protein